MRLQFQEPREEDTYLSFRTVYEDASGRYHVVCSQIKFAGGDRRWYAMYNGRILIDSRSKLRAFRAARKHAKGERNFARI